MKMKHEDIIFDDFENAIRVKYEDEFSLYDSERHRRHLFATILTWSKSFNQSVVSARKDLGLIHLLEYPTNATIERLISFISESVSKDGNWSKLKNLSEQISKRYHLTNNWQTSIELAILTNTMPVAYNQSPIQTYEPKQKTENEKPKVIVEITKYMSDLNAYRDISTHPSIYFTEYVSPEEIIDWVRNHRPQIKSIQRNLPKPSITKRDNKTIYWGRVAWIIKQEKPKATWTEITSYAQELTDSHRTGNSDSENVPGETEFRNYYENFAKDIKRLNQTNK